MARFVIEGIKIGDGEIREETIETTPEEDAFYAEVRDLISKLSDSEEVTVLVLRAHLIIEQLIIRITESLVKNPKHIRKANRLQFATRVIFLRSLVKPLIQSDNSFWKSIELLNGLRNDLAHKLDLPVLTKDIDAFVAQVAPILQLSERPSFNRLSRINKLKRCLNGLCKFTSGMLAVTWQERSRGA